MEAPVSELHLIFSDDSTYFTSYAHIPYLENLLMSR